VALLLLRRYDGGVPVGVIDRAWIEGDLLMGEGRFDMEDERAADVARKVHQQWLRFVSVDLDDDSHEIGCIGENRALTDCSAYAASDDPEELPSHQGIVFTDWRLMGATLVSQPAFPEAFLASYTTTADVVSEPLTDASALTAGGAEFAVGSMPFADRGRSWDAAAARKSIAKWASSDGSGDKDTINWPKYGRAFLVKPSSGSRMSIDNVGACTTLSTKITDASSARGIYGNAESSATTKKATTYATPVTNEVEGAAHSLTSTASTAEKCSKCGAQADATPAPPSTAGKQPSNANAYRGSKTTTGRSKKTGPVNGNDATAHGTTTSSRDSTRSKTANARSVSATSPSSTGFRAPTPPERCSITVTPAALCAACSADPVTQESECSATVSTTFSEPSPTLADTSSGHDFGQYAFPIADVVDGQLKIVWAAVVAAASVVQGGRGGTKHPTASIKSQLTALYNRARREFNDPSIKAPWEGEKRTAAALVRSHTTELAVGQFAPEGWRPPDPWFNRPPFSEGTPWTVAGDRVFGHLALWNVCHIGIDKRCVLAPPSQSGYAYYATRLLETKGAVREVGLITMDTGHASLEAGVAPATAHYDNTGAMAAAVAIGEDEYGIWCAGSLLPTLTEEQRLRISLAALSGDWRQVRGGMELVAALAVNTPGFPQTRARSGAAGAPFSAVGCGAVAQDADGREARAEHVFGLERQHRAQLAAHRIARSRIAAMQKRMSALSAPTPAEQAAADEGIREGEPNPDEPVPWHIELSDFLIAALEDPDIREACEPTEDEASSYAAVAEQEEMARRRRRDGNGENWIERTTTGHLPTFVRRVADHLMAKGMTESHAIAVAVNVIKKWCRGGAGGNPADGLNWPRTQRVTAKTRAQGCRDLAHWEAKRAETRAHGSEETETLKVNEAVSPTEAA